MIIATVCSWKWDQTVWVELKLLILISDPEYKTLLIPWNSNSYFYTWEALLAHAITYNSIQSTLQPFNAKYIAKSKRVCIYFYCFPCSSLKIVLTWCHIYVIWRVNLRNDSAGYKTWTVIMRYKVGLVSCIWVSVWCSSNRIEILDFEELC